MFSVIRAFLQWMEPISSSTDYYNPGCRETSSPSLLLSGLAHSRVNNGWLCINVRYAADHASPVACFAVPISSIKSNPTLTKLIQQFLHLMTFNASPVRKNDIYTYATVIPSYPIYIIQSFYLDSQKIETHPILLLFLKCNLFLFESIISKLVITWISVNSFKSLQCVFFMGFITVPKRTCCTGKDVYCNSLINIAKCGDVNKWPNNTLVFTPVIFLEI